MRVSSALLNQFQTHRGKGGIFSYVGEETTWGQAGLLHNTEQCSPSPHTLPLYSSSPLYQLPLLLEYFPGPLSQEVQSLGEACNQHRCWRNAVSRKKGYTDHSHCSLSAARQGKKTQWATEAGLSELEEAWMEVAWLLPVTGSCIISVCEHLLYLFLYFIFFSTLLLVS